MSGDILHDIDAAIEDHEGYVEWHGSADAATWTADGSHEVDARGHYYAEDEYWDHHQALIDAMSRRPMDVMGDRWVRQAITANTPDPQLFFVSTTPRIRPVDRFSIFDEATAYVEWHGLGQPDPAEFVRETVATWQPGPTPIRPIEAVLRDIVKERG